MSESSASTVPDVWTVLSMILWSATYLEEKGVPNARLDAEHLLAHVTGVGRLQLYLEFERPLSREELDGFRPLLKRRAAREPLQYIVGNQPFRGLELRVRPGVLIPRPETEVLVDLVLAWWKGAGRVGGRALDVGTGTGAIALSLASEGAWAHVLATDVDEAALTLARENAEASGLDGRVEIRAGSLFEPLDSDERFDVIVSNPPYVPEVDASTLEPEVREWEPGRALFGGSDGLDVVTSIVQGAGRHLTEGGLLALEVGRDQARAVRDACLSVGTFVDARIHRDYSGRERFVLATRS